MPVFLLCIKATLENVQSLQVQPGTTFCIDVQEGGGSEVRRGVCVSATEVAELSGSKGTANLVMKFAKDSRNEASINVQEVKGTTRALSGDDSEQWVPIIAMECRGLTPIAFEPTSDCRWNVTGAGGTKFEDIDLSEKEWSDYDEKLKDSVGIYGLESKFVLHK